MASAGNIIQLVRYSCIWVAFSCISCVCQTQYFCFRCSNIKSSTSLVGDRCSLQSCEKIVVNVKLKLSLMWFTHVLRYGMQIVQVNYTCSLNMSSSFISFVFFHVSVVFFTLCIFHLHVRCNLLCTVFIHVRYSLHLHYVQSSLHSLLPR